MAIKETLEIINAMEAGGVIGRYAIAGAVAAYNYIEPAVTDDLDILVSFHEVHPQAETGLITLEPIFSYLKARGYDEHRKEGIVIAGWPVRFLPIANDLDAEALAAAQEVEIKINETVSPVRTRVLRAEHIVATCLRIGRPRDFIRITQFLEEAAVDIVALCAVLDRHALVAQWQLFCRRTGMPGKNKAMKHSNKTYPDISDILTLKWQGRRGISQRSFGTKIAMVETMRERLAPLKRLRESRTTDLASKKSTGQA
jgi:hypothetical protein